MKNKYKIMILALVSLLQFSCYKDHTTEDIYNISEISITLEEIKSSVINLDKNEVLSVKPIILQEQSNKELSYEWKINHEIVSTEKDLNYSCTQLGTFPVRLKVSNEDGSTFKNFTLNVNSPYEEGIVVLGEAENGQGSLSFMRKFTPEEIASGRIESFATNVFTLNNPAESIGKSPSDVVKRANQLYIASKDDGKVSVINDKTFELEALITAPEFPSFKPAKLNIPNAAFTTSLVLTESGEIFTIATKEGLILKNTILNTEPLLKDAALAPNTAYSGIINFTSNYFWDKNNSRLWNFWYVNSHSKNTLQGQDLIQFFPMDGAVYVLTKDKNNPSLLTSSIFGEYIQVFLADPVDLINQRTFTNADPSLKETSIILPNKKYIKLVYANERTIYNWFYSGVDLPSKPFINIEIPGVITALASNPEGTELYVGVYDATASGMKGSMLVYNMDNGQLLKTFKGIADKPVKILYKPKN